MIKKVFSATFLIFLTYSFSFSQHQAQEKWVDSVFQKMSMDEKIGQLFMIPAYPGGDQEQTKAVAQKIKKYHIGGLLFMQGKPAEQVTLTNRFQAASDIPLLIGMDMEYGMGLRVDSVINFPKQLSLGANRNDSLTYALGKEIARQMDILGVHMNFSPVVNINSNPDNPIENSSSFGSSKVLVAERALAYMKGLQENGALACARHFPGIGDIHQVPDQALPVLMHSKARLDSMELFPFRKLAAAGVAAIMTAHVQVPSVENSPNTPASLSDKLVNILRQEMNYEGLLVSEALNMKVISENYEPGEAEVLALKAGNDILLFSENIPEAVRLIKRNLRKKKLLRSALEESVKRVLRAKYKAGLNNRASLKNVNLTLKLNKPEAAVLSQKLYEGAVTIVKNEQDLLPISILDNKYFASLSIGPSGNFTKYLDKYASFMHYEVAGNDETVLYRRLQNYDVIVVGLFEEQSEISKEVQALLHKLSEETKLIFALFKAADNLKHLEKFEHIIAAYESNFYTHQIVPSVIFGSLSANGRLPVAVSEAFQFGAGVSTEAIGRLGYAPPEAVGMDSRTLSKIDDIAREAITDKATPGCQVLVAKDGKIIYERSFGFHRYDSIKPVTDHTLYDIASITKVLATMQVFMFLEERGLVDLDKKISVYLPDLVGSNKEHMIIRDILTHQAGLWPYLPFWKKTVEESFLASSYYKVFPEVGFQSQVSSGLFTSHTMQDSVWQWVKQSRVRDKERRVPYDYKYSDLGYYLLQRLIENIINQPMDQFLQQNFYDPMGLTTMSYLPLCKFPRSTIAPTENDDTFRKSLVYGMVHDEGAAICGGVAGHAGLFSNAIDLAKMMQMHLQDGFYGGTEFFQPGTIEKFTRKQYHNNRRGVGWDKPLVNDLNGPTSKFASGKTFGHTGFTGTAVWADPEFNLIYVFLSNRIHPDANNSKLIKNNIRTRIQDAIYESMWRVEEKYDSYKQ